jgi:energy-coupling factor transport system substrate-specific component
MAGGKVRSAALIALASSLGFVALAWPLIATEESIRTWNSLSAPLLSAALLPFTIGLIISDVVSARFNTKTLALVGILTAIAVAVRPLGAGVAGIEPIWLIIIISGRVLGSSIGFVIGSTSIIASAFITGGVGPWLPYQMMLAAWMGMGAGWLPKVRGKSEIWLVATYGAVVAFIFGWMMNLWFWPTAIGLQSNISFEVTDSLAERVEAWIRFSLATSLGFDIPRALFTAALLVIGTRPLSAALRRATRKVVIDATAEPTTT